MIPMISDSALKKALETARDCRLRQITVDEAHVFSPSFEAKMEKLIKSENKLFHSTHRISMKRVAICFIIALTFAMISAFSVSSQHSGLYKMNVDWAKENSLVTFEADDPTAIIKEPFVEYELGYLPVGFALDRESVFPTTKSKKAYYSNGESTFSFYQMDINSTSMVLNTEGVETKTFYFNGTNYSYLANKGDYIVFWNNDKYAFIVAGNIDEESAIDIAKFTRIADVDGE